MKNKILFAVTILLMAFAVMPAAFADASLKSCLDFSQTDNDFSIKFKQTDFFETGDKLTVIVLKPGYDFSDGLTGTEIENAVFAMKIITKVPKNSEILKCIFSGSDPLGEYKIKVSLSGSGYKEAVYHFFNIAADEATNLKAVFSGCSASGFSAAWEANKTNFSTDGLNSFNTYIASAGKYFVVVRETEYGVNATEQFKSTGDIFECIKKSITLYACENLAFADAKEVNDTYGFPLGDIFDFANDYKAFYTLYNNVKTPSFLNKQNLLKLCAMANMQKSDIDKTVDDVKKSILNHSELMGIDLTYAADHNVDIAEVAQNIDTSNISTYYNNSVWFSNMVDAIVSKRKSVTSVVGNTSSGIGGGGGSVGFIAPLDRVDLPTQNPDNEQQSQQVFNDMSGHSWAADSVKILYNKGVVSGDGSGSFKPDANVTRAEFITMICLAFDVVIDIGKEQSFNDISQDDWYYPYIAIASSRNIVNGIGNGDFGAGNNITRQDMATMFLNVMTYTGKSIVPRKSYFEDEMIDSYAKKAVDTMAEIGVINGYEDGTFRARNFATRAEAAVIIVRLLNYIN